MPSRMFSGIEAVTLAPDCHQMTRGAGIGFDLFAEPFHQVVNRAVIGPCMLAGSGHGQKVFAREHGAGTGQHEPQDFGFRWGQGDRKAIRVTQAPFLRLKPPGTKAQPRNGPLRRFRLSSQHGRMRASISPI